jgi:hypothetical protein
MTKFSIAIAIGVAMIAPAFAEEDAKCSMLTAANDPTVLCAT